MVNSKSATAVLAILTLSHLAQHLYVGVSVLYPDIKAELSLSYSEMGIVVGIASIFSGFLQIFFSLAARSFPRRVLMGIGNILYSVSILGLGLSRSFYSLIASNIVGGIGSASQHPLGVSMLSDKFSGSVAKALGIFYGLGYVGNIAGPLFLTSIAWFWGWRNALFALTVLPASIGLVMIIYLRGESVGGKSIVEKKDTSLIRDLLKALKNKSVLATLVAQSLAIGGTGQGAIVTYTPMFLKNGLRIGPFETTIIYSIAMGGGILGTVIMGKYSDRIGHLKSAILCTGLSTVAVFSLIYYRSYEIVLIPHLFITGLLSFPIFSLLQSHIASTSKPSERDILMGLFLTLGFGSASIWSALLGFLIDAYGSFTPVWMVMSALSGSALIFQFLAYKLR